MAVLSLCRPGSVIADVDVDVPSKSAQISASYLAVALVNITGQSTTLAGQTGTVGITVDGMESEFSFGCFVCSTLSVSKL